MDNRDRILSAAARVYSQHGFRGATTRLIAQEADVNEVTLFRTFGSKEALIEEAIRFQAESAEFARLPDDPQDPEEELSEWCHAHIAHIRKRRPLIISCMADVAERPEIACGAAGGANRAWAELRKYLERLKATGKMDRDVDVSVAGSMFMGTAFGDAMGREMLSEMFPWPPENAAREYTRLFLRAIAPRDDTTQRTNGRGAAARTTTGDNRS
jgi:AcrR family transcriptional regulator